MKFREMDSVTKLRAMGRATPVLARIGEDQAVSEALVAISGRKAEAGETRLQQLSFMLHELGPVLLETHAEDLCELISIMTGKPLADVMAPGNNLIADIRDFLDEDFLGFFTQSVPTGQKKS